jgi:hypothetical protein
MLVEGLRGNGSGKDGMVNRTQQGKLGFASEGDCEENTLEDVLPAPRFRCC